MPIQGISDVQSETKHCVKLTLCSKRSSFMRTISCSVLKKITGDTPSSVINISDWDEIKDIKLADPSFNIPAKVDLLLGAEIFYELLKPASQIRRRGYPTLIKTELGWVLSGNLNIDGACNKRANSNFIIRCDEELKTQVQRFWEIEVLSFL